jgi:hypothetical protein
MINLRTYVVKSMLDDPAGHRSMLEVVVDHRIQHMQTLKQLLEVAIAIRADSSLHLEHDRAVFFA